MDTQLSQFADHSKDGRTFWVVYGLLGLCLAAWPMAAFVALFIFDAPIEGRLDELARYSALAAVWSFPLFYVAGFVLSLKAKRQGRGTSGILRGAILPLLPFAYIAILWMGAIVYTILNP